MKQDLGQISFSYIYPIYKMYWKLYPVHIDLHHYLSEVLLIHVCMGLFLGLLLFYLL